MRVYIPQGQRSPSSIYLHGARLEHLSAYDTHVNNTLLSRVDITVKSIINAEEDSLYSEATGSSPSQIPRILWKPKIHYPVHKSMPSVFIRSQINSAHALESRLTLILLSSSHLRLGLPRRLSFRSFNRTLYNRLSSHLITLSL